MNSALGLGFETVFRIYKHNYFSLIIPPTRTRTITRYAKSEWNFLPNWNILDVECCYWQRVRLIWINNWNRSKFWLNTRKFSQLLFLFISCNLWIFIINYKNAFKLVSFRWFTYLKQEKNLPFKSFVLVLICDWQIMKKFRLFFDDNELVHYC